MVAVALGAMMLVFGLRLARNPVPRRRRAA